MACKYCGKKTRKVVTSTYKDNNGIADHYIICNNCKNVLHRPPSHIPEQQRRKYLEKVITKNDNTQ